MGSGICALPLFTYALTGSGKVDLWFFELSVKYNVSTAVETVVYPKAFEE